MTTFQMHHPIAPEYARGIELARLRAHGQDALADVAARLWAALNGRKR